MTDKLDILLQSLRPLDEKRLVGLEGRVWQRIENSKPYTYFAGLPLWLKSLPIATTLLVGGAIGASASPTQQDLDVFSMAPAYSISKIMAPCCDN